MLKIPVPTGWSFSTTMLKLLGPRGSSRPRKLRFGPDITRSGQRNARAPCGSFGIWFFNVYYHLLSSIIIYYHLLSSIIIYYHLLSSIIIYYHLVSYIIIYYHLLSSITIYYLWLSFQYHVGLRLSNTCPGRVPWLRGLCCWHLGMSI